MNSLKEFEKQVKTLIAAENWAEAYKICNQILIMMQKLTSS